MDREIQNLVDKETTVEGWLGRVDERYYSLDLIKSQVSALLRKLMDRQDIGKNSDNLYKMNEHLYNLEILLSTGDEIMAASHNEPNVYRNSAVNYDNTDLIIEHLPHRLREDMRKMIKPSMVKAYEHLAIITSVIRKEADERRSSERRLGHLKDRRNELFGKPPQKQPGRKVQAGERETSIKLATAESRPTAARPNPVGKSRPKCVICSEEHAAWHKTCRHNYGKNPEARALVIKNGACVRCLRPKKRCEEDAKCDGTSLNRATNEIFSTDCPGVCKYQGKPSHKCLCACSSQKKQLGETLKSTEQATEVIAQIKTMSAKMEECTSSEKKFGPVLAELVDFFDPNAEGPVSCGLQYDTGAEISAVVKSDFTASLPTFVSETPLNVKLLKDHFRLERPNWKVLNAVSKKGFTPIVAVELPPFVMEKVSCKLRPLPEDCKNLPLFKDYREEVPISILLGTNNIHLFPYNRDVSSICYPTSEIFVSKLTQRGICAVTDEVKWYSNPTNKVENFDASQKPASVKRMSVALNQALKIESDSQQEMAKKIVADYDEDVAAGHDESDENVAASTPVGGNTVESNQPDASRDAEIEAAAKLAESEKIKRSVVNNVRLKTDKYDLALNNAFGDTQKLSVPFLLESEKEMSENVEITCPIGVTREKLSKKFMQTFDSLCNSEPMLSKIRAFFSRICHHFSRNLWEEKFQSEFKCLILDFFEFFSFQTPRNLGDGTERREDSSIPQDDDPRAQFELGDWTDEPYDTGGEPHCVGSTKKTRLDVDGNKNHSRKEISITPVVTREDRYESKHLVDDDRMMLSLLNWIKKMCIMVQDGKDTISLASVKKLIASMDVESHEEGVMDDEKDPVENKVKEDKKMADRVKMMTMNVDIKGQQMVALDDPGKMIADTEDNIELEKTLSSRKTDALTCENWEAYREPRTVGKRQERSIKPG